MTKLPKINFIGNKLFIAGWISELIPKNVKTILDGFSGGTSVSYELKRKNYTIYSNDILHMNYILAKAFIENNHERLTFKELKLLFSGQPKKGYMFEKYSSVLYYPEECMQLDQYRENINLMGSEYKKAIALSLIRRAMIRKMPYSRFNINWEKIVQLRDENYSYKKYKRRRAYHNESFEHHILANFDSYNNAVFDNAQRNKAFNDDIFTLIPSVEADLIYMDPPYGGTLNDYFGFYSPLDEYVLQKEVPSIRDSFINKKEINENFDRLIYHSTKFKYCMLSYSNSSIPSKENIEKIIKQYSKKVIVYEKFHNYRLTGKENKSKTVEYLFFYKN